MYRWLSWVLFLLTIPALVAAGAFAASPTIYKWVDENGIAHYTSDPDRIPSNLRDRVRALRQAEPPEAPASDVRAPETDSYLWAVQDANPVSGEEVGDARVPNAAEAARLADLDARIAALQSEVDQDEETLKDLISTAPAEAGVEALADDPGFREIARRFPKKQADLDALRQQRARLDDN